MDTTETTATPAPATKPEYTAEEWFYAGRRLDAAGKLFHVYVDAQGEELNYAKQIAGRVVGSKYQVKVLRTPETVKVVPDDYRYIGLETPHAKHAEWVARDAADVNLKATKEREKADGTQQLLTLTLAELRKTAQRMPAPSRRALAAHVLDVLLK